MAKRKYRRPDEHNLNAAAVFGVAGLVATVGGGVHAYWYLDERAHSGTHPAIPLLGWIAVVGLGIAPLLFWIAWALTHRPPLPESEPVPVDFSVPDDARVVIPTTRRPGVIDEC